MVKGSFPETGRCCRDHGPRRTLTCLSSRATAKRTFKGDGRPCIIAFGTPFDTDVEHGIRSGRLKIPRQVSVHVQVLRWGGRHLFYLSVEVAPLFEPSIRATVNTITQLVNDSKEEIAVRHRVHLNTDFLLTLHS